MKFLKPVEKWAVLERLLDVAISECSGQGLDEYAELKLLKIQQRVS